MAVFLPSWEIRTGIIYALLLCATGHCLLLAVLMLLVVLVLVLVLVLVILLVALVLLVLLILLVIHYDILQNSVLRPAATIVYPDI